MTKRNVSCITTSADAQATKICRSNPTALISPPPSATTPYIHNLLEAGLNILIADDNPINLSILKKGLNILFKNIRRLEEASNGHDALKLLHLHTFDILLLDIDMPILNGIDTTKKIRKSCCLNSSIPIIAITTNYSIESRENYMKIGMNDCLSKPVDLFLLEQSIFKALLPPKFDSSCPMKSCNKSSIP